MVVKALNKIKTSHGSGVDNIASYFLKVAFPVISNSLCDILNLSLSSGIFPDSWKVARVAPNLRKVQLMKDQITGQYLFYQLFPDYLKNWCTTNYIDT